MKLMTKWLLALTLSGLCPTHSLACACGCGAFDIGTSAMFPTDEGGMTYLEYDFMDQNRNWSGTSHAPAANNNDKQIRTHFITAGVQYMFNRKWGLSAEVPYWQRHFKTTDDSGNIVDFSHDAIGDVRLRALYTGLSPDMSTGLTFGVKLPTGDHKYANFDPDTEIGTGSTDLLLGAYHTAALQTNSAWNSFVNGQADLPIQHVSAYRPGMELDGAVGVYYNGWQVKGSKIAPIFQIVGSYRMRDGGPQADPAGSGYERLLLTPGFEVHTGSYKIYADVGLPVYQNVNGNQLVASALYKINISHDF